MMTRLLACALLLGFASASHAISARYARQLERSGCTQVSETQGCDITRSRAENARAGFVTGAPASGGDGGGRTPYAGRWVAVGPDGAAVANIRIDARERVWVDGKRVQARRGDGALLFKRGALSFVIQGDRRLTGEDVWSDGGAGSKGRILAR